MFSGSFEKEKRVGKVRDVTADIVSDATSCTMRTFVRANHRAQSRLLNTIENDISCTGPS